MLRTLKKNFANLSNEGKTKALFSLFIVMWVGLLFIFPMLIGAFDHEGGTDPYWLAGINQPYERGQLPLTSAAAIVIPSSEPREYEDEQELFESLIMPSPHAVRLEGVLSDFELFVISSPSNDTPAGPVKCTAKLPSQPSFILRLDDIQAYGWTHPSKTIIEEILEREMSVTLSVIPGTDFESAGEMREYLISKASEPRVEVAQHGIYHTVNEFRDLTSEEAKNKALEGKTMLWNAIGALPVTFIPPYNAYKAEIISSISEDGFAILSGKRGEFRVHNNLLFIGYTDTTAIYSIDENDAAAEPLNDVRSLMWNCETEMNRSNLCVIMVHPQDYVSLNTASDTTRYVLDPRKYEKFLELLDALEKTGAKSITFQNLLTCEGETYGGWDLAFLEKMASEETLKEESLKNYYARGIMAPSQ